MKCNSWLMSKSPGEFILMCLTCNKDTLQYFFSQMFVLRNILLIAYFVLKPIP